MLLNFKSTTGCCFTFWLAFFFFFLGGIFETEGWKGRKCFWYFGVVF